MFFILSKVLDFMLSPLLWVILIFFYAFFCKKPSVKKKVFLTGIIVLLFFSNSSIVNEAFLAWEEESVLISDLKEHETAIVLTGITTTRRGSPDKVFFSKGADRLLHTVQLYRVGKIKRIIISGGSGEIINKGITEASELKKVFIYCGILEKDIILEDRSRNTVESSLYTKALVDSLKLGQDFLLITSAFHIPRSVACFEKVGLNVRAYPVDFYSNDRNMNAGSLLLPSEYALWKWSVLIHEICGYFIYKIMGYY